MTTSTSTSNNILEIKNLTKQYPGFLLDSGEGGGDAEFRFHTLGKSLDFLLYVKGERIK
mgnify:CR=1 FL=1